MAGPSGSVGGPWKSRNYTNNNGSSAAEIQRRLNSYMVDMRKRGTSVPYSNLTVDGILGTASDNVIRWYQQQVGLTADGIVGSATWSRLKSA